MEKELKIDLEKYLIVVDDQEEKVVYDVDDSSIFSSKIVGCGRGARNAVLNKKTFKTLEEANLGIRYLNTCSFRYKFKAIKVSELKEISKKGWGILVEDVEDYNWDVNCNNKAEKERKRNEEIAYLELRQKAISLVSNSHVFSIEKDDSDDNNHGEKEGALKYKEHCLYCSYRNTLERYVDKYGKENGYKKWIEKNEKISKANSCVNKDKINEYIKYRRSVLKQTRRSLVLYKLENIEKRSKLYHLDHKISIVFGFNNEIPVEVIGSIYNLEIISAKENTSKKEKNSQTIKELIEKIQNNFKNTVLNLDGNT